MLQPDLVNLTDIPSILGLIFFNTWFTDFFSKYLGLRRKKKIKIKITKNFFFYLI